MKTKERFIECFEAIAHSRLQIVGDLEAGAVDLISAQVLIEPRIHALWQQVAALYPDPIVDSLRTAESVSAFIVGVLAGLDLAGRPEIVSPFAELYAFEAKPAVDRVFAGRAPWVNAGRKDAPNPKVNVAASLGRAGFAVIDGKE